MVGSRSSASIIATHSSTTKGKHTQLMMRNVFMLAPILLIAVTVVGIVLITLGVRGRPVFASPRCRKCGYDLRNMQFMSAEIGACPECGARLSGTDSVTFGRWQRRPTARPLPSIPSAPTVRAATCWR